jgi:hypothetical protein
MTGCGSTNTGIKVYEWFGTWSLSVLATGQLLLKLTWPALMHTGATAFFGTPDQSAVTQPTYSGRCDPAALLPSNKQSQHL